MALARNICIADDIGIVAVVSKALTADIAIRTSKYQILNHARKWISKQIKWAICISHLLRGMRGEIDNLSAHARDNTTRFMTVLLFANITLRMTKDKFFAGYVLWFVLDSLKNWISCNDLLFVFKEINKRWGQHRTEVVRTLRLP